MLATALLLSGLLGAQNTPAAQLPVGVVDFGKVLEAYPKAAQEKKRLEDDKARIDDWVKGEVAKLKDLRLQRDGMTGTDRDQMDLRLDLEERRITGMRQIQNADLQEKWAKFVVWFHEDVDRVIQQVVKARNLQLVLRSEGKADEKESTSTKARLFNSRMVWFASDSIDITGDVIRLLMVPQADPGKAVPSAAAKTGDGKGDGKADSKGNGKE